MKALALALALALAPAAVVAQDGATFTDQMGAIVESLDADDMSTLTTAIEDAWLVDVPEGCTDVWARMMTAFLVMDVAQPIAMGADDPRAANALALMIFLQANMEPQQAEMLSCAMS